MSRSESEVADELTRLNCSPHRKVVGQLASNLVAGEAVLHAITYKLGWAGGHQGLIATAEQLLHVTDSDYLRRAYWIDVENVDLHRDHIDVMLRSGGGFSVEFNKREYALFEALFRLC